MEPEDLIGIALDLGAEQAEVYQTQTSTEGVSFEANRLKQLEFSQEEGCALTVWQGDRAGISVAYGPVSPYQLAQKALAALHAAPAQGIPRTRNFAYRSAEEPTHPPADLHGWGEAILAGVKSSHLLAEVGITQEISSLRLCNSEGLEAHYRTQLYHASLGLEWVRGEDFLQVYAGDTVAQGRPDLPRLVAHCLERVRWATRTLTPPTGTFPVLLSESAVDLLWGPVLAALNGQLVLQGASPWTHKQGERVLSPQLTLYQDPTQGVGLVPFDDEGTPTQRFTLVKNGILQGFYSDLKTATQLGHRPMGNGFRGSLGSFASPDLVNFLVAPGSRSLDQWILGLDRGLIIDQIMGGDPGINGDFSANIELGYWVEGGVVQGRVKDTMVAGNIYDLLTGDLEIANHAHWQGDWWTPAILLPGVAVRAHSAHNHG